MAIWSPNQLRALIFLLVLLAGGIAVGFYRRGRAVESALTITAPRPQAQPPALPATGAIASRPSAPVPMQQVLVVTHVAGAVKKPGVYRLPADSRVDDAIKAAGGAKQNADLDAINLAATVLDGSRLLVPVKTEDGRSDVPAAVAPTPTSHASSQGSRPGKFTRPGRDFLNLNTATGEELQRLPGVGPAMSARILDHRKENGPFTDPEQLMDVSGIGEKKFAKMKPFVRVR